MPKGKKTKWRCVCCGYTEINYKHMDASYCPKCRSIWWIGEVVSDGKV